MEVVSEAYVPADQRFIDEIVRELKSQGIFDQFRKECISDVDTKPAYQNLRQRVENSVSGFLTKQNWSPDMNKNQVREMLRKNIYESGFFEIGVERIVDQVVNPKINTVFFSKVEDVVYKILGIEKPSKTNEKLNATPKINTFQDILQQDSEAAHPETGQEIKDEVIDVKVEDESPAFETLEEKIVKDVTDENSIDSQFSVLSGVTTNSHESNHSLKQESIMSLNSSESRMSLVISENTSMMDSASKIESDDVFFSQKSSDSNSKQDLIINENVDTLVQNEDTKLEPDNAGTAIDESTSQQELKPEEIDGKSRDSSDKKRERHQSSSEKSKSKSDRDKSRPDKYKKEEKETSKDQKVEKEKYRIPKLSDKIKNEKDTRSKDKDGKNREKTEKDRKVEKDRKSSKHSSDKDKSKSDKNKRDNKSDKKDREKDEKREKSDKKESSKTDKSKDDKKSSSRKRDSSSSKDRHKDKESNARKSIEDTNEKNKNGHASTNSSSVKKDSSKPKKEEDKYKSSRKKDDKSDKDEKKRKRDSKDDHYSSKEKYTGRRSSDRDSDGPSNNKRTPPTPQKDSDKYSSQKTQQESSCSNIDSASGESGNSDKVEEKATISLLDLHKIKLPKFASNLQEAMKIVRIRKQLKKLENAKKLDPEHPDTKKLLEDIASLTKDTKVDEEQRIKRDEKVDEVPEIAEKATGAININDFISSSNISMAKWNALEAKFMEELGNVDYDSYESPYLDDEDSNSIDYSSTYGKIDQTIEKILQKPSKKLIDEQIDDVIENKNSSIENGISCPKEEVGSAKNSNEESKIRVEPDDSSSLIENEDLPKLPESNESSDAKRPENRLVCDTRWDKNDNLNKRAVIILQKNAIAEEMIKKRKNGEHPISENHDENEEEKIEMKEEAVNVSDNNVVKKTKGKKSFNNKNARNNTNILDEAATDEDPSDHSCKGFESMQNTKNLTNMKHLITTLEESISQDVQKVQNVRVTSGKTALQARKQGQEHNVEATNNNLEHSVSKGRKNKNVVISLPTNKSTASPRRKRTNDENVGILNGLSLPLGPTENEAVVEKKNKVKSHESFGNEETKDLNETETPNKKIRVSGRNSTGKKSANQRYSSEDLYKPRMFLRRSAKDSKNP